MTSSAPLMEKLWKVKLVRSWVSRVTDWTEHGESSQELRDVSMDCKEWYEEHSNGRAKLSSCSRS